MLMAEIRASEAAGQPEAALASANKLFSKFGGAPEAESARALIPQIEAALRKAEEEERARVAAAQAAEKLRVLRDKWTYDQSTDEMTGRTSRTAIIESENTVEFDFPYQGAQHARLMVRDHPTYGRDVIFAISRGQLLCHSYEDCTIRVRFDERAPESWSAVGPADNSTELIFLRSEGRFVQRLRNAEVVRIQVPVYQEGNPAFEFQVGGFEYQRFSGGK